ncbi:hypothetical protein HDU82_004308 [Entophlyctis luteolus]|nr:hypothetical protein HDU82_004308 [Entophlyctis luteolus]
MSFRRGARGGMAVMDMIFHSKAPSSVTDAVRIGGVRGECGYVEDGSEELSENEEELMMQLPPSTVAVAAVPSDYK